MLKFFEKIDVKVDVSVWVFLALAVVILWQMLLPGYILTLDMVFTPHVNITIDPTNLLGTSFLPITLLIKLLSFIIPIWLIQKFILVSLFFCLGYLPYKFLPFFENTLARYLGALFYIFNPFVYTRFLAGHWKILFAYAFLAPFFYYLIEFYKTNASINSAQASLALRRKGALLFLWLFLISIFSPHIFVMTLIITGAFFLVKIIKAFLKKDKKIFKVIKYLILYVLILAICCSYWLVPYILNHEKAIFDNFTAEHWKVFSTSSDERVDASFNVLTLYGFWNEGRPWANYFLWPKTSLNFWIEMSIVLGFFILLGIGYSLREKEKRFAAILFLLVGAAAFIFSCGMGDTIFQSINHWFFTHISFWRGFRDTNKFSALLAVSYAYFFALGASFFLTRIFENKKLNEMKEYLIFILLLLPVINTYTMLGGFSRQFKAVEYPKSWYAAEKIFSADEGDYKILSLPWHEYYSLKFNQNIITYNPAIEFFSRPVIESDDMEMITEEDKDNSLQKDNRVIDEIVKSREDIPAEEEIAKLKLIGVKYILFSHDLDATDNYKYEFLSSNSLEKVLDTEDLTVFKL